MNNLNISPRIFRPSLADLQSRNPQRSLLRLRFYSIRSSKPVPKSERENVQLIHGQLLRMTPKSVTQNAQNQDNKQFRNVWTSPHV